MKLIALESQYWKQAENNGLTVGDIEKKLFEHASLASKLLANNFEYTNIMFEPVDSGFVIPETGCMGITYDSTHISMTFDYEAPYELSSMLNSLGATLQHELVHAHMFEHDPWKPDVMFGAVTEGLATVFERDYASSEPPWGKYESDEVMHEWFEELKKLPDNGQKNMQYFVNHDDGRKWIVYKTGTWLIDALVKSGEDIFELMKLGHKDILKKFDASGA